MIRLVLAGAALASLAACAMRPEGTSAEDAAAFDVAVASIGCDLRTESDYLPVELQTGLSREQVQGLAQYRAELGQMAEFESGGYRLLTGACEPKAETPAEA
ncbi:hypothetical protein [Aestuariicoccus sp. MJ-SS9]|uniref:hypothetical protein n=1 Tax=Aestuariicoccus sp. MJ-SS9 TaxID=3079855 RepID=UPI0029112B22|nr:hypothetical protein [Aestuariicoccus sp. MJ-SS9]MDU8910552.1 hypothetical protein [Aestuariicoccus sp. MJ-SS9]